MAPPPWGSVEIDGALTKAVAIAHAVRKAGPIRPPQGGKSQTPTLTLPRWRGRERVGCRLRPSCVDVLVEPALRIARIEGRGVALEDVEAVGGGWISRVGARHQVTRVRPRDVDRAVHRRHVDVVAPETDLAGAVGLPVVVAGEVGDLRLRPVATAITRPRDKRIDGATRVLTRRRISRRAARGVAGVAS